MFKINRILATGFLSLRFALGIAGPTSNRLQLRKPTSKARHRRDRTATPRRTESVGKPHIFMIKSTGGITRADTTSADRFKAM
ncbi:hypothetical protein [Saccharopolyspora oryzae]|uniref:Secreted protein n=1 Tax=Saccharopolyspora oryzae TaxID=2997343 RepID=A0ABT4V5A1_9PSEU|nr:hypothetical protein [Saccharopolyspora oryzae]MDA3629129.1 hypothetical protein [Saccharopolyspora oryzae]